METIYKLPEWGETILIICVAITLTGLAIWLAMNAIKTAIDAEAALERKRRKTNTQALNGWQKLYEEEHQNRISDNATLINEVTRLQCENKRMKERMAKVMVKDL